MNIYSFVEDLVKKFENPNLRMSFITFSTEGHTVMKLTSDSKVHSMIICLTDGTLEELPLKETIKEADKARKMGATVYCVGLMEIADSPYHVFAVDHGFKALKNIVDPLESKSCIEITSVEPSDICVGDEYELMISGKGFNNAKSEDDVICRFKFKDKQIDEKANSVKDTSMICPGIKIENPDETFSLEISLNNGISFINNDVSLTSKDCASARTVKEPPPVLNPERGKLDSLCEFVQRCNQMSVMWCPTRDMVTKTTSWVIACDSGEKPNCSTCHPWNGKCVNFALMRPHCAPLHCSPKPGVLYHQQLLLTVPTRPNHVLQASLQNAAVHLYPYSDSQQSHFVTPAPIAQALKHQNPKIIKSPLLAELDIYIESWFTVKMRWNLLLIRVY
ncbi:hypothetical protein Celaphus_00008376, partial [Cervus elaphus hippelaphus]